MDTIVAVNSPNYKVEVLNYLRNLAEDFKEKKVLGWDSALKVLSFIEIAIASDKLMDDEYKSMYVVTKW